MVKRNNSDDNIYYVGINTGTLGFLQEINKNQIKNFIDRLNTNEFKIQDIGMLEVTVDVNNKDIVFNSLNEVIIRDKDLRVCKIDVNINDELLEHFGGEGILVSTSTGSTAENLSHNGSIVYNGLQILQITPIGPTVNSIYKNLLNSVIVPENTIISLIPKQDTKDLLISSDGENKIYKNVSKITIKLSDKNLKCLRANSYTYTKVINDKFLK